MSSFAAGVFAGDEEGGFFFADGGGGFAAVVLDHFVRSADG